MIRFCVLSDLHKLLPAFPGRDLSTIPNGISYLADISNNVTLLYYEISQSRINITCSRLTAQADMNIT
jgi:hypothetical protein